jgi:hypothetical protein
MLSCCEGQHYFDRPRVPRVCILDPSDPPVPRVCILDPSPACATCMYPRSIRSASAWVGSVKGRSTKLDLPDPLDPENSTRITPGRLDPRNSRAPFNTSVSHPLTEIRIAPMSAGDSSAEAPLLLLPLTPLLLVMEPVVEPADPDSAAKTMKR